MFGFGKKKKAEEAEKAAIDKAVNEEIEETSVEVEELKEEEENSAEVIKYDRVNGPHDIEEVSEEDLEDYVDLGALRIKMHEGMNLRLETDDSTGAVIAATITREGATLQVQAFAAPRTTGIWDDIRHDLTESVASQGGTVEVYAGVFGAEMLTRLPAVTPDGKRGERIARFVGVDGPAGSCAASSPVPLCWATRLPQPPWRRFSAMWWWTAVTTRARPASCCP